MWPLSEAIQVTRPFLRWGSRHVSVSVDWCPLCYSNPHSFTH